MMTISETVNVNGLTVVAATKLPKQHRGPGASNWFEGQLFLPLVWKKALPLTG